MQKQNKSSSVNSQKINNQTKIIKNNSNKKKSKSEDQEENENFDIDVDRNENDKIDVEKEVEVDIIFLLQNAIGIFSVLEFSLLGILTHGLELKKLQKRQKKVKKVVISQNEEKDNKIEIDNSTEKKCKEIVVRSVNCLYCNLPVANSSRCARCKGSYCDRTHQQLHWNVHKVSRTALSN